MDTKDMIKIVLVVGVVILFMAESFYIGGGFFKPTSTTAPTGTNITGTSVFNGTIRTYDPILIIPINTSQPVIDQLRLRSGVRDVKTTQTDIRVQTETRDDVYPLGAWLRSMNVTSYSIANIAVNRNIEVLTATGKINATVPGGIVRILTEPVLDVDHEVTVSMGAIINTNQLIDYTSASLLLEQLDLEVNASVIKLDNKVYSYSIPWESRNSIGNLSQYGVVDYKKLDSIIFNPPLTINQIFTKKMFPYIVYIDASSAQVSPSFDNITQIRTNFQDTPFTLPDSKLTIQTNRSLDLPFNSTVEYNYVFKLQNPAYKFDNETITLNTLREYDLNSTVGLNLSVLVLGDKVISIKRVLLPS
jgi:hypothetical protein